MFVSAIRQSEAGIYIYIYIYIKRGYIYIPSFFSKGFLGGTVVKNLPAHAGDSAHSVLIPGSGRSSGVGNGNPL